MAHNLIVNYGLYRDMEVFVRASRVPCPRQPCCGCGWCQRSGHFVLLQRPALIDHTEMTHFHADDYINFLRIITPDNMHSHLRQLQRCAWDVRATRDSVLLRVSSRFVRDAVV